MIIKSRWDQLFVNFSWHAVIVGFAASHSICTHGSWPENPASEGVAET